MKGQFYTFRGYSLLQGSEGLTPSMEDYLEMICRLSRQDGYTRAQEIANALHVKPPSVSRMVQRLARKGFVRYEKYDIVRLTPEGEEIGLYLMKRHELLEEFLRLIGLEDTLSDAEKVEHNLSDMAISHIARLMEFFDTHPENLSAWRRYLDSHRAPS